MSGILALSSDRPEALAPELVRLMLDRLAHRGPDGVDLRTDPGNLLAHLHFWTTPEEAGERQPLLDPGPDVAVALDGRLDNREDLLAALGERDPSISDARLLLRSYVRWGTSCFPRLLGSFAAVLRDGRAGDLLAVRDPLGDRTLFYASIPGGVALASEPHALRAHPAVDGALDETSLARYFAIDPPRHGATFFKAIRELPAGCFLVARGDSIRIESYFRPEAPEPLRYRRDEEYAEHLASVLGDAVEVRLRSSTPVGVTLSGGMDSTPVAALAVERARRRNADAPLRSFSWVFDELAECDERRWIVPVVDSLGLDATFVTAEPHWPLRDAGTWPVDPSSPFSNCYQRLKHALWAAAAARGTRVLLVGAFSEDLLGGHEAWLASLLDEGRWSTAAAAFWRLAAASPRRPPWRDPGLRAVARRYLPFRRRSAATRSLPAWLTPEARRLVAASEPKPPDHADDLAGRRLARVFSELAFQKPADDRFTSAATVELRDPFRDLRFVRLMLAMPPHQLRRGGTLKYCLRNAMRRRLPAAIVDRTEATPLDPFYRRSVLGQEAPAIATLLGEPRALWREYVDAGWLRARFPEGLRSAPDGRDLLVPYFAAVSVLWERQL